MHRLKRKSSSLSTRLKKAWHRTKSDRPTSTGDALSPETMAESSTNVKSATLDPSAPSFSMPEPKIQSPTTNGTSQSNKPVAAVKNATASATPTGSEVAGAGTKLTPAQLKKQKADEKAARRAEKVAAKGPEAPGPQTTQNTPATAGKTQRRPSVGGKRESTENPHHKRTNSQTKALPIRPSQNAQPSAPTPARDEKRLNMVSHLRSQTEKPGLASAGREIHPAVLSLGLQLRDYIICGANARCAAMLLVFKKVIQSYTTPPNNTLSRHLITHLSHQISYINNARSLGISQGNAIRWLKQIISAVDPDLAESDAKVFLCAAVDQFIRERITLADEVIAREAREKIEEGDVVLTYGKSSVVEKTLITAYKEGKRFSVIVADSRPMYEGKNMARSLLRQGIETNYCLVSALGDVVEDATKCMLGAAAMLGNGRLSARAGTAMVAMMVKQCTGHRKVPVMVLCESVKFTGRVALDSMMHNELGDPETLVEVQEVKTLTTAPPVAPAGAQAKGGKKAKEDLEAEKVNRGLEGWRDLQGLYLLDLMYDVTPAEFLDIVISELGSLPPSAVPEVNRLHGGEE